MERKKELSLLANLHNFLKSVEATVVYFKCVAEERVKKIH